MKKKLILLIIVILLVLFVPIREKHLDGGTIEYKALTYRIFKWNRLYSDGSYYVATDVYFFPKNFHKFEYYEPITTPVVTINYNEDSIDTSSYAYHWSKTYGEEVRFDIADGSAEDIAFVNSLIVDSDAELTFTTDFGIEEVEYTEYNESSDGDRIYNGLTYNQETKTLLLPSLEPGEYVIKFKLYNEDDYAMYAFKITIQGNEMPSDTE